LKIQGAFVLEESDVYISFWAKQNKYYEVLMAFFGLFLFKAVFGAMRRKQSSSRYYKQNTKVFGFYILLLKQILFNRYKLIK